MSEYRKHAWAWCFLLSFLHFITACVYEGETAGNLAYVIGSLWLMTAMIIAAGTGGDTNE